MKIRKLLLTCTAIAGLSAAFAVAANAATYNKTNGTVSFEGDLTSYAGDQMTVILIPESAYKNLQNGLADKDILYIDQDAAKADSKIFQDMGVKGGKLDPGTYYLRVGGTNIAADGILEETVVVAADGKVYHYGNLVGEYVDWQSIDNDDVKEILKLQVGKDSVFDDYFNGDDADLDAWIWTAANLVGDLTDWQSINNDDAKEILKLQVGKDSVFDDHFNDNDELDWTFKK